jgi:hypothetical protein
MTHQFLYKPHKTADLIIELPDTGHLMSEGRFDRNMCFDPPGAEIIYAALAPLR